MSKLKPGDVVIYSIGLPTETIESLLKTDAVSAVVIILSEIKDHCNK